MVIKVYQAAQPERGAIDALTGDAVLEFGANWCGICRASEPLVTQALAGRPGLVHLKVEDGPGRPLGRSFRVKLWPTLIFLRDGQEVGRLVRPTDAGELQQALALLP